MPVTDNEELEFASKEDLEKINASPELQRIYNAMKAGVTKKFQGWSGEKKTLNESLASMTQVLNEWEQWRPIIETYDPEASAFPGAGDDDPNVGDRDGNRNRRSARSERNVTDNGEFIRTFKTFQGEVTKAGGQLANQVSTLQRQLEIYMQLDGLRREHSVKYPDIPFDDQKVLGAALERNYSNLEDAYASVYREDFVKKDVEKQVTTRIEEEKARLRVPGETGSGNMPTHFKLPEATPKGFSDASRAVLDEIKAGTLTKADK